MRDGAVRPVLAGDSRHLPHCVLIHGSCVIGEVIYWTIRACGEIVVLRVLGVGRVHGRDCGDGHVVKSRKYCEVNSLNLYMVEKIIPEG